MLLIKVDGRSIMDRRLAALELWVEEQLATCFPEWDRDGYTIKPASSDASFRRYFRAHHLHWPHSLIVMDAPPDREDSAPFVSIARTLNRCEIHVPLLYKVDLEQGFLLLSDLGTVPFLQQLDRAEVESLYGGAMETLLMLQQCWPSNHLVPDYDHPLLMREMELFRDWYLKRHCGYPLSPAEEEMLVGQFNLLTRVALEQPKVAVHRDYHSRNLMVIDGKNPGVLDFQDAVFGPITYDLVSLLRDCYIKWPDDDVERWVKHYYWQLVENSVLSPAVSLERFVVWFDWMGVQRHLKAVGIFARLNHRDGKPGYLEDIPRTLSYIVEVTARYPELAPLSRLVSQLS